MRYAEDEGDTDALARVGGAERARARGRAFAAAGGREHERGHDDGAVAAVTVAATTAALSPMRRRG